MKLKSYHYIFSIFILVLIVYYPSLFKFFTHDDFFLLDISRVRSIGDFFAFFNLIKPPEGLGMYRPLAMQSFYMFGWFFKLNPLPLHIISFISFAVLTVVVYRFSKLIFKNDKVSLIATLIYSVSSSHFSHLYFLGAYQEILVTIFVMLSSINFLLYLEKGINKNTYLSYIFFILGLLCKETALVTPLIYILLYFYKKLSQKSGVEVRLLNIPVIATILTIAIYFFFRFKYYGFPQGDSYLWDFGPRIFNTLFWYAVWSLNIPEMLVNFVGPGLKVNITPLLYWKNYILSIFAADLFMSVLIIYGILKSKIGKNLKIIIFIFGVVWFLITFLPVLFLPWHKFSYYLTLPMFGTSIVLAYLISNIKSKIVVTSIIVMWIISSIANIKLFDKSNWMSTGPIISKRIYLYIKDKDLAGKNIIFYDTVEDAQSPWQPSNTVKNTLSDDDFFKVFFPSIKEVVYQNNPDNIERFDIKLRASNFIK